MQVSKRERTQLGLMSTNYLIGAIKSLPEFYWKTFVVSPRVHDRLGMSL